MRGSCHLRLAFALGKICNTYFTGTSLVVSSICVQRRPCMNMNCIQSFKLFYMIGNTFVMDVIRDMLDSRWEFIWVCNNLSIISSIEQGPPICNITAHISLRRTDNWGGFETAYFSKHCSQSAVV